MKTSAPAQAAGATAGSSEASHDLPALLELASRDPKLPATTRALLVRAIAGLRTLAIDADAARSRYRTLFDAVPDPVSIIAEDGTVLDLNKAGMAAYRRPREEIIGRNIDVLNPDLPRDHMIPVWETLNRGETYVVEVTNMRADGSRFPVEVHSANFEYEGRKAIVAVARDLSQRGEAETRYRELMELIDMGILIQDMSGKFLYGNSAALRMIGLRSGESLDAAMQMENWIPLREDGSQMPYSELPNVRCMNTGRIVESCVLGMYHRGRRQLAWLSATVVPQYAAGASTPHQLLTLFSDVTHLKRNSTLFDRAQALAHIGGWEIDLGRDRAYLTGEARRILGLERKPESVEDMFASLRDKDRKLLRTAINRVTGGDGFDLELQGVRASGEPYWVRMIGELETRQTTSPYLTGTVQDITTEKRDEESLRVLARTDPLTTLLNRDAILEVLEERLADPAQAEVAVLYIDLDRFKTVNDALGHNAGDELLVRAARRIANAVGTEGLIARIGGDEFLVACDASDDPQQPERVAGRILSTFADGFRFGKDEFAITASIGIARAPQDGSQPQELIQNADLAMYDSKRRGRNSWQVFTPDLARRQQDRLQIETQLRRAVDNNEFHLVYQPQVDLRHGHIVAAEALIRWQSQELGELRPDLFISHAESTGDIVRIGQWVLREACRQIRAWRDQGLGIVRVAVNVSYRQFLGDELAEQVRGVLDEFSLPGSALELEFTERVLIEDAPATLRTFADLRALGVVLTIDDFGEGYSALNYLRRLPIHGLKLSQLFTEGVPNNRSDVAVCQAVSGIARSLGLGLVAEGVESEAQRRFLLGLGVPVGQGFLFAQGLPPEEFARRLQAEGPMERAPNE